MTSGTSVGPRQPEQMRRRQPAKERAVTARQHRREIPRLERRRAMTHAIHAGVRGDQRPAPSHQAMRFAGQPRQYLIRRPILGSHNDP
jgi:hypothetical protein